MNFIIEYFVKNSRLNYTLMGFIVMMGIFAYINIPKEMFPNSTVDSIMVRGNYSGASANSLNNFAVVEIENQIDSVSGISKSTSTITDGSFSIKVELQDGVDKSEVEDDIKTAVTNAKKYLPSDMTEPTVSSAKRKMALLNLSILSTQKNKAELLKISEKLKTKLSQVNNVSEISIFGDSDLQIKLLLDHKKIDMYGLDSTSVVSAISNLSYIYPVAKIEKTGEHLFVSATNNKFDKDSWLNTILRINSKNVFLKDIATLSIDYPEDETISRLNGQNTISLNIYKNDSGDAISMADNIKLILEEFKLNYPDIHIQVTRDNSYLVDERIKVILSNILFGLILIALFMHYLISPRLSFVIILGIPTSFIIGVVIIEYMGYSLNLISLMAILISLGIVVDDAIIVSENIQRHLDEGASIHSAVVDGTKEVIAPVLIASLTTVCAFLPLVLVSGEFGRMVYLIPIMVTVLIIASLIESFIFLPLHAKHILKRKDKVANWTKAFDLYEKILHITIHYKKTFLLLFFITIPALTYLMISMSRFQMMPDRDSTSVTLSFKLDESYSLQDTNKLSKKYEKALLENKKELFIKNIDTTIGRFTDVASNSETIENGFTLALELEEFKSDNILDNYINPLLNFTFDFNQKSKLRTISSNEVQKKVREYIKPLTQKDKVVEFNIVKRRFGIVKTDIELKLSSSDDKLLLKNINLLKKEIENIPYTKDIADNTNLGEPEYKFTLNSYAQSLGLTDTAIAKQIANLFMEKEQTTTFNSDGVVKIKTQSLYKDDLDELKHFLINIDNKKIELQELVDFTIEKNFAKLEKENGQILKKVYANIDNQNTSANEVLNKLAPIIKKIEQNGISISFGGEREKSSMLSSDLFKAFMISLFLIFIVLLINFPSFKSAFIIISVIPFTIFGAILGHLIVGINLNSQSFIGMLGLAGVVINDGIVMLEFLKETENKEEFYKRAKLRLRPIFITSITTILGLFSLMFFATGENVMMQAIAVSLGFGLAWGTILNLIYVPALYATLHKIKD